MNTEPQYSEGS